MIFLVGHHAAGKSEIAHFLSDGYNFLHFETGEIVRSYKKQSAPEMPTLEWVNHIQNLYGQQHLDHFIARYILNGIDGNSNFQEILITGNRSANGVRFLIEDVAKPLNRSPLIVYVEASPKTLYERFINRKREASDGEVTFEQFNLILQQERESGLDKLRLLADKTLINDYIRINLLYEAVDELFSGQLGYRRGKELA